MAQFTTISQCEMSALLIDNGFVKIFVPGTNEEVWSKLVRNNLCIRVYTSVQGSQSRSNGKDSIKVCLVSKLLDGQVVGIGKTKRVHRVMGWATNLQKRIDHWEELLGPKCVCGCYMVNRESNRGPFWGCSNFPVCRNIKTV